MKAYKYERYSHGWHWSQGIRETLVYIPGADFIIYKHGNKFGINKDDKFIAESKQYVEEVLSGKVNEGRPEYTTFFVKKIPETTEGNVTTSAVTLQNFKEIDLNITDEGLKELLHNNDAFLEEKQLFEQTEKVFYHNLKNLILEQ